MRTSWWVGLLLGWVGLLAGLWWLDQATSHRFPVPGSGGAYLEVEDADHLAEENQSIDIWYTSPEAPRALVYRAYYDRTSPTGTPLARPDLSRLAATSGPGHNVELTLGGEPFFTFRPPASQQPFRPPTTLQTGTP
jgi:hypothetical protein